MNQVDILYGDDIRSLENRIRDFSIDHNVLSVDVYSRPNGWSRYGAIVVYND